MSRPVMVAMLCLITTLNFMALAVNLSSPSRAAAEHLNYQELVHDQDFIRAVKSIAEACAVNVDIGKLKCQ